MGWGKEGERERERERGGGGGMMEIVMMRKIVR